MAYLAKTSAEGDMAGHDCDERPTVAASAAQGDLE
jgi:hypothetical protein